MPSDTSAPLAPPQGAVPTQPGGAAPSGATAPSGVFRTIPAPAHPRTGPAAWSVGAENASTATPDQEPEPKLRQLLGVCGWAAVLGGIGLIVGVRGLLGLMAGDPPGWYEPSIVIVGLAGIGLSVAAFLTVHRERVPWMLLGGSSLALLTGMILTAVAF